MRIPKNRCGGTIITADTILTAANCLYDLEKHRWASANEISVFQGNFSTPSPWRGTTLRARRYKVHENFVPNYGFPQSYDIALIKLQTYLEFLSFSKSVLQVCHQANYQHARFIGLGLISELLRLPSNRLMETKLYRHETCGEYSRAGQPIDDSRQVCYNDPGRTYVCHGDVGGPLLVHKRRHNLTCILGISSYVAKTCTDARFPPIFTSATVFSRWVSRTLGTL